MADRDGDSDFWARAMYAEGPTDDGAKGVHIAQIDAYVMAWHQGTITTGHKRQLISEENKRYYGLGCARRLTWP